jgi:hypothetical protein
VPVLVLVVVVVPLVTLLQLAILIVPEPLTAIELTRSVRHCDPLLEIEVPPEELNAVLGA